MCPESHFLCFECQPKVDEFPEYSTKYNGNDGRTFGNDKEKEEVSIMIKVSLILLLILILVGYW